MVICPGRQFAFCECFLRVQLHFPIFNSTTAFGFFRQCLPASDFCLFQSTLRLMDLSVVHWSRLRWASAATSRHQWALHLCLKLWLGCFIGSLGLSPSCWNSTPSTGWRRSHRPSHSCFHLPVHYSQTDYYHPWCHWGRWSDQVWGPES